MSPLTKTTQVLEESAKIKAKLLKVQAEIEAAATTAETKLLAEARQELGYDEADEADGANLVDSRVATKTTVLSPKMLSAVLPVSKISAQTTEAARQAVTEILQHRDPRLLVIIGPCSIHDPRAALEYAEKVAEWRRQYSDRLEIIMRTYIEKPRTELGWKGFIYDPLLDGSDDINLGLVATRMLACQITDLSVPIAVERLNALTPQYLNALVAYDVIGARNTTDQKSREYASATSSPVGFKNTPEGSIDAAAQAIVSASGKHAFLGIGSNGTTKQINSSGNNTGHIILRGDAKGPNYSAEHVAATKDILRQKGLMESIVIDASHGNSGKVAANQKVAIDDIAGQVANGEPAICGVMIESNLVEGAQNLGNPADLVYGQSITDACVGLDDSETMLATLAEASAKRAKA
ncbi:MAG TPA: 3-deoxy-7-phosphoheptulonate synthase [Candidatus Saccharimonadales bacterium]